MYELLFTTNEKMKKPEVIEVYADNGQLSHYALVDAEIGNKLWSEAPEECKAMGYPVVNNDCIHSVSNCSQGCEWKADTFDNIGIALTEYCEECGAKRDCC